MRHPSKLLHGRETPAPKSHLRLPERRPGRRSVEYGGEIAAAAISQNSFVGRVQATAFSEAAPEGKECACVKLRAFATSMSQIEC
jgi:hypothetical protein